VNQRVNISQGLLIDVPFYLILFTCAAPRTKSKGFPIDVSFYPYTFNMCNTTYEKQGAPYRCSVLSNTFYTQSVIGSRSTYHHTFHNSNHWHMKSKGHLYIHIHHSGIHQSYFIQVYKLTQVYCSLQKQILPQGLSDRTTIIIRLIEYREVILRYKMLSGIIYTIN
jgi:hypothetical protein